MTQKERLKTIVCMAIDGKSNREIAESVGVSVSNVAYYVTHHNLRMNRKIQYCVYPKIKQWMRDNYTNTPILARAICHSRQRLGLILRGGAAMTEEMARRISAETGLSIDDVYFMEDYDDD